MIIRKATLKDLDQLITLRLNYLKIDHGSMTVTEEDTVRAQLINYIPKHLEIGDFIVMVAEEENIIVSTAFLVIVEKPANLSFLTGRTGTLLNVLTNSEYRRKGIALRVVSALMEEAKKAGVSQLDLCATEAGKPLYEKLGFLASQYTSMKLKL